MRLGRSPGSGLPLFTLRPQAPQVSRLGPFTPLPRRGLPPASNQFPSLPVPMANRPSRPLPIPPGPVYPLGASDLNHIYSFSNPYQSPHLHPPYGLPGPSLPLHDDPPAATLRGGTILHKGFYDLLALIPTPSPSRFLWGASADPAPNVVAGPRYEDLPGSIDAPGGKPTLPAVNLLSSGPVSPKKGKRISKDMVSKPIGFVYVYDRCTSPSFSLKFGQPFSACI
jgi:hypothetical protein